jgi:hypothetical protein
MQDIDTATSKPIIERKKQYTNADIIEALTKTKGMVYLAAQALKCDPVTIHRRALKSPAVKAAIEASRGEVLDVAEVALMAAIQRQEAWAIAFALKTIGKGRGYVERQEISAVPPEQLDAAVERELARLAAPSEVRHAGEIEGHAEPVSDDPA